MRKLTEAERNICNKQINRFKKEITNLKEVIEYAQRKLQKLKVDWDFEDFARPLERKQTEENSEKTVNQAKLDIKELEEKIQILIKQIKEGVKEPSGTG